jgi:hypothetical protein
MQCRGTEISLTRPAAFERQWGWSVALGGDACARRQSLLHYTIQTAKRAIDKLVKQDGARTSDQNPGSGNAGHAPDGTFRAMP